MPFGVLWVPSGSVWILRGPFGVPSGSPWASLRTLSVPLGFLRGVLGPGRRPFRRTWASLPMDLEAEDAQKHVFLRGLGVGTFGEHAKTRVLGPGRRPFQRTWASLPMDLEAEDAQKHVFLRGLGIGTFGEHAKTRAIRHICRAYAETRVFTCFPQMCRIACVFTCFLGGSEKTAKSVERKSTCFYVFSDFRVFSTPKWLRAETHVFLCVFERFRGRCARKARVFACF